MNEFNRKDMLLESPTGFVLPLIFDEKENVQIVLKYGKQVHPGTGEDFFHHGIDIYAVRRPLYAVASGTVVGLGNEPVHGNYLITRHGKYDVKMGHLSEAYVQYGHQVVAGQPIALTDNFLHLEVKYGDKELDPEDFLELLKFNMESLNAMGLTNFTQLKGVDYNVKTDYDKWQEEIEEMMMRLLPMYFNDLSNGQYQPPVRMQQSLRNTFAQAANKNYFFEQIPGVGNPLGLTGRAAPLASKIQNIIIQDFLNYAAMRHGAFIPSWNDAQKKNFQTLLQRMGA